MSPNTAVLSILLKHHVTGVARFSKVYRILVKYKFQINKEYFFSVSLPHAIFGTYLNTEIIYCFSEIHVELGVLYLT